jgi:threonine/homoserine/homoserine lactone efflux protein
MTIFSFMFIFAAIGFAAETANYWRAAAVTLGVFVGSAAWWLVLSSSVALLRARIRPGWMRQVNRISGAIIVGFAIAILVKLAV